MASRIKWKCADAPVGRYSSFAKRGWPTAYYKASGKPAAFIRCKDAYIPAEALTDCPTHAALTVTVCHHNHEKAGNSWALLNVKERPASLAAAKRLVERVLAAHPEFAPVENKG